MGCVDGKVLQIGLRVPTKPKIGFEFDLAEDVTCLQVLNEQYLFCGQAKGLINIIEIKTRTCKGVYELPHAEKKADVYEIRLVKKPDLYAVATRYGLFMVKIEKQREKFVFNTVSQHFTSKKEKDNLEMLSLGYLGGSLVLFGFRRDEYLYVFDIERREIQGRLKIPLLGNAPYRLISLEDFRGNRDAPCKHYIIQGDTGVQFIDMENYEHQTILEMPFGKGGLWVGLENGSKNLRLCTNEKRERKRKYLEIEVPLD